MLGCREVDLSLWGGTGENLAWGICAKKVVAGGLLGGLQRVATCCKLFPK